MYQKIAVAGVTAAVIIGAGTAALATTATTSGSPAAAGASVASTSPKTAAKHPNLARLGRREVRAQIVTRAKDGTFVTHDVISGQVIAVSATSLGVRAADGTVETFVVNSATKVRLRTAGKGAASSISQVRTGDQVLVLGTGTSTVTAKHVLDVKK